MRAESFSVTLAVDASGDADVSTGDRCNGRVLEARYTPGTLDTGADLTITGKTSGKAILTITNGGTSNITWQPRQVVHPVANTGAGTALTFDGTNEIYDAIVLAGEEIRVVVSNGGVSKSGSIEFIVG